MSFDWTPYLASGEEVLWQGQPDSGLVLFLTGSDLFLVPFASLFWLASPLIVAASLTSQDAEGLPPLGMWLFPMIWIAYFMPGRAIFDRRKRKALRYAITRSRVLRFDQRQDQLTERTISPELHSGTKGRRLTTVELDRYKPDAKVNVPRGMGLLLGDRWDGSAVGASMTNRVGILLGYVEYGLELRRLPDGRDVAKLLRQFKAEARP